MNQEKFNLILSAGIGGRACAPRGRGAENTLGGHRERGAVRKKGKEQQSNGAVDRNHAVLHAVAFAPGAGVRV